jgi:hypothetical protein
MKNKQKYGKGAIKKTIKKVKQKVNPTPTKTENVWYDLGKVIDWIEDITGFDIRSPCKLTSDQNEIRNKKLFPYIKQCCT